jgi:hypothetical protein
MPSFHKQAAERRKRKAPQTTSKQTASFWPSQTTRRPLHRGHGSLESPEHARSEPRTFVARLHQTGSNPHLTANATVRPVNQTGRLRCSRCVGSLPFGATGPEMQRNSLSPQHGFSVRTHLAVQRREQQTMSALSSQRRCRAPQPDMTVARFAGTSYMTRGGTTTLRLGNGRR